MRIAQLTRWMGIAIALLALAGLCGAGIGAAHGQETQPPEPAAVNAPQAPTSGAGLAIAIGLSVGLSCLGAGYAVGHVGAAAIGAASENPEMMGRSLVFVALGEGIAIYGLLVALLLWIRL